jgi:hypothetical protein
MSAAALAAVAAPQMVHLREDDVRAFAVEVYTFDEGRSFVGRPRGLSFAVIHPCDVAGASTQRRKGRRDLQIFLCDLCASATSALKLLFITVKQRVN